MFFVYCFTLFYAVSAQFYLDGVTFVPCLFPVDWASVSPTGSAYRSPDLTATLIDGNSLSPGLLSPLT